MLEKLLSKSTISLESFATSVPAPTAMPISAFFNAGASFIPSPVIATISPFDLNAFNILTLWPGLTLAKISVYTTLSFNSSSVISSNSFPITVLSPIPILFAIACAVNL